MKDSVILGSGNSRYLKSVENFKTLYPTYDDFAAALVAGTLPIDLNGINAAGFQQVGDALNKYNLLKDATAALYGLPDTAVPDDVLSLLSNAILLLNGSLQAANGIEIPLGKIIHGQFTTTGAQSEVIPIVLDFSPRAFFIWFDSNSNQYFGWNISGLNRLYYLGNYINSGTTVFNYTNFVKISSNTVGFQIFGSMIGKQIPVNYIAIG